MTTQSKPRAATSTPAGSDSAQWMNAPNAVTIARLGLSVVLFYLIWLEGFWITSTVLFVVAVMTDALDGYLARKYGQVTTLGRILDPFVDKIIICGAFVFLLEKRLDSGVNSWMAIIVISREMFVSSLRGFLERTGRDFSASMAGKVKMVLQSAAVTGCLLSLAPEFHNPSFRMARDIVLWAAIAATLWSGWVYVLRARQMLLASRQQ